MSVIVSAVWLQHCDLVTSCALLVKYNSQAWVGPVMMIVGHSVQELPRLLELVLPVPDHELVQVPGGVPGRVNLVGRVKRGEVDLKLVVVLPVELHLLKPVTPQNLTRQIGSPEQWHSQFASLSSN